jgi:hypothetical protein
MMGSFIICALQQIQVSYDLGDIIKKVDIGRPCSTYEIGNACTIWARKSQEKRSLKTRRRRLEDNIKMDLNGIGWTV